MEENLIYGNIEGYEITAPSYRELIDILKTHYSDWFKGEWRKVSELSRSPFASEKFIVITTALSKKNILEEKASGYLYEFLIIGRTVYSTQKRH